MNMFDIFGNWIQINDRKHSITIEDYGYDTGVITGTTGKHCAKCVAVNQCWFKNELEKKPKKFDITKIEPIDYVLKKITPGLYHLNCHCEERPIFVMKLDEIKLIVPTGKIEWLFRDKSGWIISMGYQADNNFINLLKEKIRESYFLGNYTIQDHTHFGVKIRLNVDLPGNNVKNNKIYKIISSFTVFPNGKIKCNTLIGGWQK